MTKQQKILLLIVLVVAGASVTYYYTQSNSSSSQNNKQVQTLPKVYSTDVTYKVPSDKTETIHVKITLSGESISDVVFTTDTPNNPASKENIDEFMAAFNNGAAIKGKKLSEVSLTRVGGASLTTGAFMEAVNKIKSQTTGV